MSLNIIAVSDLHFDEPSLLKEEDRKKLEELKKSAFKKIIDEAISRNVSAFLICGDLYNERSVSFETYVFLRKCFLELLNSDIKICYAHGKSDPNPVSDIINTPNLIEFAHQAESFDIIRDGAPVVRIWASGYCNDTSSIVDQFQQKDESIPVIGMMYEEDAFSKNATLMQESLAGKNYDLFILGGYHHYVVLRRQDNILYLGSPTGIDFTDRQGGVLIAEITDDGQILLDKLTVSDVSFYDIEVSNITETDIDALTRRFEAEVQKNISDTKNTFVRIVVSGRCALANQLTDEATEKIARSLSETLDISVYVKKENLMPILPKSLLIGTSPLVESLKIVDTIKNDDKKFRELLKDIYAKQNIFYKDTEEDIDKALKDKITHGLTDTICRVMIREDENED